MPDTHTRTQHTLAQCPMCAYEYRDPIRDDLLAALELARQALVNLQAEGESRYMPIVRQADAAIAKARGEE